MNMLINYLLKLIKTYQKELKYHCQSFTNSNRLNLSGQEITTIFCFLVNEK